ELHEDSRRTAVIDSRFDDFADRITFADVLPRIGRRHFTQRERQTLLRRIDFTHPSGDARADGDRGVALPHAERQLRVVNQSVDARLDLYKKTEVGGANNRAAELRADRVAVADVGPRIGLLIFHGQRDAFAVV